MTNYTKSTNFTSKDSLPSGDALKIIKGAEFDTEFNAIATAIATKYDSNATVPVANGGTGATTASGARTNLGVVIGTNVQAWDAELDTWATKTAPSGTVVGTSDTQTLTNKTLIGAVMSSMASSVISSGTAQASTSGTNIDFTSIPSWVKRITVMFNGVSTNGTSSILVQLGDAGGVENTGYVSTGGYIQNAAESATSTSTAGFIFNTASASNSIFGFMTICTVGSNAWVSNGQVTAASVPFISSGGKTLSDTLTQVRITTVGGTDTFDAGSINILYE